MAEGFADAQSGAAAVVFSVTQITEYISRKMFSDPFLSMVRVVGEVTNFSFSSAGHAYFSLKDSGALLDCIVYDYARHPDSEAMADGALLEVGGRVSFYKKNASIRLIVESAAPGGIGELFARLERIRQKLLREGLFSAEHKKELPEFALRIGVVTSPSGAVLHDIVNVSTRRFEGIRLTVYPVPVQGADAASRICRALEYFNEKADVDVIIVARGGGSFEDLAPFNEESVARAVYASAIPVVSAVGHETDFTLCDMAADLRAPTPSAAAELVVREKQALLDELERRKAAMQSALTDCVQACEARLSRLKSSVSPLALRLTLARAEQALSADARLLDSGARSLLDRYEARLARHRDRLEDLSPMRVLERGYAVVHGPDGVVTSARRAHGDMQIEFADGRVSVTERRNTDG